MWAAFESAKPDIIVLDVGATIDDDARQLVDFSILGAALARTLFDQETPSIGLLNIGTEEIKGTDDLRVAANRLKEAADQLALSFEGFTEADKLCRGDVDVAVTDGFSGNVALKAVEGTARFVADLLRRSFASSLRSKIGFLISRPATELLKHHLDPNNHNGAVFLGLNGVVVKSHGSANAVGVAHAVAVAAQLLEENLIERIGADLARLGQDGLMQTGSGASRAKSEGNA